MFRGRYKKLILLEFWYVGCAPCMQALPFLHELSEKYDRSKFEIISIEFQNSKEVIEKFIKRKELKFNYQILFDGKSVANEYGIQGAPTFILINDNGDILLSEGGFNESIDRKVESAIKNNI
jgi:thiol-disulfide isomerase/thioredoxin